ncbi:MAG: hypothetical protein QGF59_16555, partial [Pirellulaceae bacterium]|nr:hypothetical protein [Pirellulaceae bacterium]
MTSPHLHANNDRQGISSMMFFVWALFGIGMAICHFFGVFFPLPLMVVLFYASSIFALVTTKCTRFSILPRLMILLYALPFSATIGYVFDSDYTWSLSPALLDLCSEPELNSRMLLVAQIGLCGLVCGMHLCVAFLGDRGDFSASRNRESHVARPISIWAFLVFLLLALVFSKMHSRPKTIFEAGYASDEQGVSEANESNMNSAFLISYLILILLFVDAEREPIDSRQRRTKFRLIFATTAYIVV